MSGRSGPFPIESNFPKINRSPYNVFEPSQLFNGILALKISINHIMVDWVLGSPSVVNFKFFLNFFFA